MTLIEFLRYVATPAGLGALVTLLMWFIQQYLPDVEDNLAFVVSVALSAVLGIGAYYAIPYADKLPPEIAIVIWPTLVWAANYLWFRLGPKRARES